jgi:hypothetical protein
MRVFGTERSSWGMDALWTGSPQWQIEGLRRLDEIVRRQAVLESRATALGTIADPAITGSLRTRTPRATGPTDPICPRPQPRRPGATPPDAAWAVSGTAAAPRLNEWA